MPRNARRKSSSGIYHVVVRGINRQDIFHEEEDYQKYLDEIKRVKETAGFEIYGYCLMGNHVHLLLHERTESIEKIMKRIGISYAGWYNKKQERVGHVFQDRYKSEPIEEEAYLLSALRYIHNNPVKAKLVLRAEEYKWSSCRQYSMKKKCIGDVVNTQFILGIISDKEEIARKRWQEFSRENSSDNFLDVEEPKRKLSDECLYKEIQDVLNGQSMGALQAMEKRERDGMLQRIKMIEGATQRQIARVTGINQSIVFKA